MRAPQKFSDRPRRKFSKGAAERAAQPFGSNRKAVLKLQAATTIDQWWAATQALIAEAAPSSIRWACVRPIRMRTAMILLRETDAAASGENGVGTNERFGSREGEAALLTELFARHPAVLYLRKNCGTPLVHLRSEQTRRAPRSRHDLLRRRDWVFGVALAFWCRKKMQGLVLLHRAETEGDFSKTELRNLRQLHPHLETALCRVITARQQQAQKNLLAGLLKPLPLPLVLCDWRLDVVCESAAGLEARAIWELGETRARILNYSSRRPLPRDLARFCRSRIDAWVNAEPRRRAALEKEEHELEHPSVPRLRAKVQMVRQQKFPLVEPLFLLRFESGSSQRHLVRSSHPRPDNFSLLARLSGCERELAVLVCDGHGNVRIARELGKSASTIKAQLHSIFKKLHVTSRSNLVAILMRQAILLLSLFSTDLTDMLLSGI